MARIALIIFLSFIVSSSVFAQLTPEQRIQDSVIGWWSNNKFDHLKPQTDPVGKKREVQVNKMVEWMKKSYTPVAGLGTSSRFINKLDYGVLGYVWNVSHKKEWTEPNGNFIPISEENTPFWIAANKIFGSFQIPLFKKTNEFYFTMQPDGYVADDLALGKRKNADPLIHPNASKYLTWVNDWQTVYLTPNNKLPFIAINKGELLQRAEESLDNQLAYELEDVQAKWPGNKKTQDEVMVIRKQKIEKYRSNIQKLRERHQNSLNDPAVIRTMQPTMNSFELDPDIFKIDAHEKELKQYYQVYKVVPELYAKMQSDQPQWIAIAFPYETKEQGNQLYELFLSMSENMNYDYINNYFFNPEKIKGIPYSPSNETQLKERLDNYRKKSSAAIKTTSGNNLMPPNVYFFDDFSSGSEGSDPVDWFFNKYGKHAVVSSVKNIKGNWLQLGYNNAVNPSMLKTPLPEDFTLEFDIATDEFNSRTGGAVKLYLSTFPLMKDGRENKNSPGTFLELSVTSGNDADNNNNNFMGAADIVIHSKPSLNKENNLEGIFSKNSLNEFTNKRSIVHISLSFNNGELKLFANQKQLAVSSGFVMAYGKPCVSCNLPAGSRFNTLNFTNITNDADNIKVYISNIKITKE